MGIEIKETEFTFNLGGVAVGSNGQTGKNFGKADSPGLSGDFVGERGGIPALGKFKSFMKAVDKKAALSAERESTAGGVGGAVGGEMVVGVKGLFDSFF